MPTSELAIDKQPELKLKRIGQIHLFAQKLHTLALFG